jgi:hypothetical protein
MWGNDYNVCAIRYKAEKIKENAQSGTPFSVITSSSSSSSSSS